MEEKALLKGLARSILAIPAEKWDKGDQECLKRYLQQAIDAGGLSKAANAAAARISSVVDDCSLPQSCGDPTALSIDEFFQGQDGAWSLDVRAQSPSVSSHNQYESRKQSMAHLVLLAHPLLRPRATH
jgi:hypothetical protein